MKAFSLRLKMMADYSYYEHYAVQVNASDTHPLAAENKLLIILSHNKATRVKAVIDEHDYEEDDNFEVESKTLFAKRRIYADFSYIKQFSSNLSIQSEHTLTILEALSFVGVPQWQHEEILESFFIAIDAAISPDIPLYVTVWDATVRRWDPYQDPDYKPGLVGAAQSFLLGLEELQPQISLVPQTESCPICLEGFVAQGRAVTRLLCPSAHWYHLECVCQWLQVSHVCPICRFQMPTEQ